MKVYFKHQETNRTSNFLWLRFLPNNIIEVDLTCLKDKDKIVTIIKKLHPTAIELTTD